MQPQRLVPAAASSDGAAAASQAEPSWRVLALAVSPCGGATREVLGGSEPSGESLQRLFTRGWWQ